MGGGGEPSVSDSYPRLQRSRDEPEPANVSRIKTEPDRHTQEFCHSVCHPFASKPNLRRSPTPQMMGVGRILRVNVRLCNSSKCHSSSNAAAVRSSGGLRELSLLSCALCGGVTMETQNTSTPSPQKDARLLQTTLRSVWAGCLQAFNDV